MECNKIENRKTTGKNINKIRNEYFFERSIKLIHFQQVIKNDKKY